MNGTVFEGPFGRLMLAEEAGALVRVWFPNETVPALTQAETPLLRAAKQQLSEYFRGARRSFDLPLKPEGTVFRTKCWQALLGIPYGETISYGELARRIGRPKAARAVGQANHDNPIPIFIPCHRVIGTDGSLVGFGGGLSIKEFLLRLEREHAN
jgi:methylated-DNA-[protein]-cysteine S-methyltransferase